MPAKLPRKESRRRPRTKAKWPVVVELDDRVLKGETVDVSQTGVKVGLGVRLEEYKLVTLRLNPPEGCAVEAQAIVLRTDKDGTAFRFLKKNVSALLPGNDKDTSAAPVHCPGCRRRSRRRRLGEGHSGVHGLFCPLHRGSAQGPPPGQAAPG